MIELLQANAQWLIVAAVFLLMMRMHGSGGGMGCCGGGHQHGSREQEWQPDQQPRSLPDPAQEEMGKEKEKEKELVASGNHRHSSGCH